MIQSSKIARGTVFTLALVYGGVPAIADETVVAQNGAANGAEQGAQEDAGDTIVSVLQARGDYSQTIDALERAGLSETLASQGPFTVFAPTDEAWEQLDDSEIDQLMSDEGLSELRNVLSYHVVPDEIRAEDVAQMGSITTIQGQPLEVSREGDQISVNGVTISEPGLVAGNGLIHGIDQVLMPRQ